MKKQTQEQVIKRAKDVHGDTYIYDKAVFINMLSKMEIICPIHGSFWQTPAKHISAGQGCAKCSGCIALDIAIVKTRGDAIHNHKYDYSKAVYVNIKSPIEIICPVHGSFWQIVSDHINNKSGCIKCSGIETLTIDVIEARGNRIHNHKYDYSNAVYVNMHTKMEIVCPIHGSFWQTPTNHIDSEKGCKQCSGCAQLNTETFIQRAAFVHGDKYDYSEVEYLNNKTKVRIICKAHGTFWQKPHDHMSGENGCPLCPGITSKVEVEWLDSLGIIGEYRSNKRNFRLSDGSLIKPDAYDPTTKTVYEFYGDYWHGNPKRFSPNDVHPVSKKTYGELYARTIQREVQLKAEGYEVISIWESDWLAQRTDKKQHT